MRMMSLKTIFSDRMKARNLRRQETVPSLRWTALNQMTEFGMPQNYAV